jgi:hypothetical protein
VAADGTFVVAVSKPPEAIVELHAPDGAPRARFTRCDDPAICPRKGWWIEGTAAANLIALTDDEPALATLAARMVRALAATPPTASRVPVRMDGVRVLSGAATLVAETEPNIMHVRALEHPRSPLVFVELDKARCMHPPCRTTVWVAKP